MELDDDIPNQTNDWKLFIADDGTEYVELPLDLADVINFEDEYKEEMTIKELQLWNIIVEMRRQLWELQEDLEAKGIL